MENFKEITEGLKPIAGDDSEGFKRFQEKKQELLRAGKYDKYLMFITAQYEVDVEAALPHLERSRQIGFQRRIEKLKMELDLL